MARIIAAFIHSLSGLRYGLKREPALREEIIVILLSLPVAPVLTLDPWKLLALWGSLLLILCVELLNTATEKLADRVSREHHELIKIAKDCGSAAVLMAILIACGVWGIVLFERLAA